MFPSVAESLVYELETPVNENLIKKFLCGGVGR